MRRAPGFTLLEATVVLLLGGIIMAALYQTIVAQERATRQQRVMLTTQRKNRLALEVLTTGLREMSTRSGDLLMASRDSLSFREQRAFALVCGASVPHRALDVVLMGGSTFAEGDTIVIYVDGDTLTSADDGWHTTELTRVRPRASCTAAGAGGARFPAADVARLRIGGAPFDDIYRGAPVRSYRSVTYALHRIDGDWTVARRERDDTAVALLGPLAPPADGGLRFRYYDRAGRELTETPLDAGERSRIARIGVTVRYAGGSGGRDAAPASGDSLVTQIFVRGT